MVKVLVADDDPGTLQLLEGLIRPEGFRVLTASDGTSALEKAKSFEPDILITDLNMPGLSGNQLTAAVRALDPARYVYVLVLTSSGEKSDKMKALLSGADDLLVKPARPGELMSRIEVGLRLAKAETAARGASKRAEERGIIFRALAAELDSIAEQVRAAKAAFSRNDPAAAEGACDEAVAVAERGAAMARLRAGGETTPPPAPAGMDPARTGAFPAFKGDPSKTGSFQAYKGDAGKSAAPPKKPDPPSKPRG